MNSKPTVHTINRFGENRVVVHTPIAFSQQASLAQRLMGNLSIATCVPHGEDSGGRQQFRLMTPEEVVTRAVSIAELAYAEFEKKDWLTEVPFPPQGTAPVEAAPVEETPE